MNPWVLLHLKCCKKKDSCFNESMLSHFAHAKNNLKLKKEHEALPAEWIYNAGFFVNESNSFCFLICCDFYECLLFSSRFCLVTPDQTGSLVLQLCTYSVCLCLNFKVNIRVSVSKIENSFTKQASFHSSIEQIKRQMSNKH